jgi:hypothetical protein
VKRHIFNGRARVIETKSHVVSFIGRAWLIAAVDFQQVYLVVGAMSRAIRDQGMKGLPRLTGG